MTITVTSEELRAMADFLEDIPSGPDVRFYGPVSVGTVHFTPVRRDPQRGWQAEVCT